MASDYGPHLDIGSDKVLPFDDEGRGGKSAFDGAPSVISTASPLRAQGKRLRAGSGREMRIMFDIAAWIARNREIFVENELVHLRNGRAPSDSSSHHGRVPSLLWQLDEICRQVDFLSVGSNDLCNIFMPQTATTSGQRHV
jgi:phosphotransferase system enzyme I (PtsP)